MRHIPRKRFSQNFLVDPQVVAEIILAIHPVKDDLLIEIGPGLGALTQPLLQLLHHLHAVEIDRDIVERLRKEFSAERLTVHSADAMKFNFFSFGRNLRVIGNLPYNISTPILFYLSKFLENIIDMHFMLQKEVVERMVAVPSTSNYGRLSVMLQSRFKMEQLFIVPPEAFYPSPKIESAFVRMIPLQESVIEVDKGELFALVVAAAFSHRRKTLRNTVQNYIKLEDFILLGIDPKLRAENLSPKQFAEITYYLLRKWDGRNIEN